MIKIKYKGFDEILKRLRGIKSRSSNLVPYFRTTLQNSLLERIREAFHQSGPGWKPLHPSTVRQKRRRGQSSKPLIATGRLLHTAANPSSIQITKTGVIHTIDVPYAIYHERGTRFIPRRPLYSKVGPRVIADLRKTLPSYIFRG